MGRLFYELLSPEEAWRRLRQALPVPATGVERVPLAEALGRVLARPCQAEAPLPGFRRSAVDGYAVQARDTFGASESFPALFQVAGRVEMGRPAPGGPQTGEAVAVPTGGMLPPQADAVVMEEYVHDAGADSIEVVRPVAPLENVVAADDDWSAGQLVLPAGRRLRAADLGALAALGRAEVPVVPRPVVAILSTGDEVVAPWEQPGPGQVRDINSYALAGLVREAGGEPLLGGICPDRWEDLLARSRELLQQADVLVLSGGSSVGSRDHTLRLVEALGPPGVLVHGVHIKPGRPLLVGAAAGKAVFGLPGHPASAMVTFSLFVAPWLALLQGLPADGPGTGDPAKGSAPATVPAQLGANLPSAVGRLDVVQVRLRRQGDMWVAEPLFRKSGLITPMVEADGWLAVPGPSEGLKKGDWVEVHRYR